MIEAIGGNFHQTHSHHQIESRETVLIPTRVRNKTRLCSLTIPIEEVSRVLPIKP